MRGKAKRIKRQFSLERITPAYAGKSCVCRVQHCNDEDHPRLCGEKSFSLILSICGSGSPPPMRGKVLGSPEQPFFRGITPAYAGKSFLSTFRAFCNQDHPRLCGEKISHALLIMLDRGSPPPMRGKVKQGGYTLYRRRITPAYAGKSLLLPAW